MNILSITKLLDFDSLIKNNNMVIIVFSANFCKPCKEIFPYITFLADENKDIKFIKVDIEEGREISDSYNIQSIPHFIFFKNTTEILSFTGTNNKNLIESIEKLRDFQFS